MTVGRPGDVDTGDWSALICAGGAARRLGGRDKPAVVVGGATLLDRVLAATVAARRRIVVGPRRDLAGSATTVHWCREDPPGGGPLAAIAAGLVAVDTAFVAVLAADLPFVTEDVLRALRRAAGEPGVDVAVLVDPAGRAQYLAAVWRTARLRAALPADPAGAPVRALFAGRTPSTGREVAAVHADARTCLDCDDDADVARARGWATQPIRPGPASSR
ncbi:molybdenum cofactor guanylyltransferase [Frankia sp. Ag45/Mut15]|uniref:Molybdenum cofactor guanylyltransferase n=1 Tax=Frankia umida TaxID=573489 RepID=A0ABT0JXK1_9ACTN|nr:molybdenum cofactor guanylyltransferase [Frankia umida]MCK9876272.1 molybdenum cofactor guanylyltransferase [Frankia umida]